MGDVEQAPVVVVEGATVPPEELRVRPHQVLALAAAVVLTGLGLAGWAVTGMSGWTGHDHGTLLGVSLNPLQNVLHLLVGGLGLLLWRRPGGVRGFGLLLALGFGVVAVYGLLAHRASWDVLNLDATGNALHLGLAAAGLTVAAWPRAGRPRPVRRPAVATPPDRDVDH